MKKFSLIALAFLVLGLAATLSAAKVGEQAPDFTGVDSNGKTHKLSDYKGKYVVLEWHNQSCPFTKKHYESGNMEALQKKWTDKGVVWFTIISSAPGAQGYQTADQENSYMKSVHAAPTAALLDSTGAIGHLYHAQTTPHMFVIDPTGKLIYNGAIDDHSTPDASDIPASKNYVSAALEESLAGHPVTEAATVPYGCSVKYAH